MIDIKITCIGNNDYEIVDSAIKVLNNRQDIFNFCIIKDTELELFTNSEISFTTSEIYKQLDLAIDRFKGYNPLIVAIVDKQINGKKIGNLFSSMQEINNKLTGKGIITKFQVNQIITPIPLSVYIIIQLISIAIRFVYGKTLIHDERNLCLYDLKMNKRDIVEIMKAGNICLDCQAKLRNKLKDEQINALRNILSVVSDISFSKKPHNNFQDFIQLIDNNSIKKMI